MGVEGRSPGEMVGDVRMFFRKRGEFQRFLLTTRLASKKIGLSGRTDPPEPILPSRGRISPRHHRRRNRSRLALSRWRARMLPREGG